MDHSPRGKQTGSCESISAAMTSGGGNWRFFEGLVFWPQDVEVDVIALDQVFFVCRRANTSFLYFFRSNDLK